MVPADSTDQPFDAIIVAGGAGERLGGVDKALVTVGAHTLLERALDAVHDASRVIVVGPPRPIDTRATFTQEQPPGSGPAAAVAHAVRLVSEAVVVVLAVDVPFATAAVLRLLAAVDGHEAAMLLDTGGRRQPLIAAYRTTALRARADEADWVNRSVRALVEPFDVVDVPGAADEALDCDTADDVARANRAAPQFGSGSSGAVSS